jgi:hypothetical protein
MGVKGCPMKLPKLHLRDLFWIVLVTGILCAWWLHNRATDLRFETQEKRFEDAMSEMRSVQKTLSSEQKKTAFYRDWISRENYRPMTPGGRQRELEHSEYKDAYFYLREFAPKPDPDGT